MLILTRRPNESLMVGDDVKVTVLGIKGNQVRVGISAPGMFRYTGKRSTRKSKTKS